VPGVALEIMLNDQYVDLLAEGIDVVIRDRALVRLQPFGPTTGAVPRALWRTFVGLLGWPSAKPFQ
jgi:hypothetical protein